MRAMVLEHPGQPLTMRERPAPRPGDTQVLLRVRACGVCRTDLHLVDGELPPHREDVAPGHQIVGKVVALGKGVMGFTVGGRVGVPWLGWTCGKCNFCLRGQENLCDRALFTGYDLDGGFAEFAVADARYCFPLPEGTATWRSRPCCARA
ncbi:alcohol dehydrogenase catalytic domain-containing protein [Deinococcus planocerae]|uniref:alcohol dehydrogenase catalytic domain-containing protein n=1 Tax=Deinococcus planocerae TaxID=1737569 RepID=UPI001CA5E64A|nr:alcohol dehydrogenase catalytic domain-containing protein [Deinococcus planocerae]